MICGDYKMNNSCERERAFGAVSDQAHMERKWVVALSLIRVLVKFIQFLFRLVLTIVVQFGLCYTILRLELML